MAECASRTFPWAGRAHPYEQMFDYNDCITLIQNTEKRWTCITKDGIVKNVRRSGRKRGSQRAERDKTRITEHKEKDQPGGERNDTSKRRNMGRSTRTSQRIPQIRLPNNNHPSRKSNPNNKQNSIRLQDHGGEIT